MTTLPVSYFLSTKMICFPYGAIGVTALYGVYCYFVLAQIHNLDGDCSTTTECRGEGTDNAPIAYLSQFFVSGVISLLGIHIMISLKNGPRCKGSIAFFVWATAHAIWGFIGWKYGNDGTGDGKGLRIYFFLNLLAYGLYTEALMEIASLASRLWFTLFEEYKPRLCSIRMMRCLQFTLGLVTATIVGGSLWCGFTPDVWVKETLDKYPNDINLPVHQCIQIVDIAQFVYTVAAALVWIAISFLFEASANQQISEWNQWYYVWGIPTSLAAAAVVACQASLVLFHLLAYLVVGNHSQDEPDDEVLITGSIAYNYANLMTGYFVHSLVCSMSVRYESSIARDLDNPEEDEERANYSSDHNTWSNDLNGSIEVKPSYVSQASRKDEEEETDRTDDGTSSSSSGDGDVDQEGVVDLNRSIEVKPSYVSQVSRNNEEEDSDRKDDRTSSWSSGDGDIEQERVVDVLVIQNERTSPIQDTMPLDEPEIMSTIADGETPSAIEPLPFDDGTSHPQEQYEPLPFDNGTSHPQEQYPLSSSIPLTRTSTMEIGKNTVCGFSVPWISPCLDVAPNSSALEAKESSLFMMDFVQSMFSNHDQTSERGVIVSDVHPLDERDPISPVALDPPSNQVPFLDCTTIDNVAARDDHFLIQHIREQSTMDSMGTMALPSALQESMDPLEQQETTTSEPRNEVSQTIIPRLLSGSMHVAPRNAHDNAEEEKNIGDSDSSTCSVGSVMITSKSMANGSLVASEHDGNNGDDERTSR